MGIILRFNFYRSKTMMSYRHVHRHLKRFAVLSALLVATPATVVMAQDDDHDAHHPQAGETVTETAPGNGSMAGMMEMMTPEMMQMMRSMMDRKQDGTGRRGMMGGGGMGGGMMDEGMMMDPGMMAPGAGGGAMMGRGMTMCPMMGQDGRGMHGMMGGHGIPYGMPRGHAEEITPAKVRAFLERRLEWNGNPRLGIGEIVELDASTITAEIVTVDGSLVQKLAFNRYPGLLRQLDD
jgi:hypothetical protein